MGKGLRILESVGSCESCSCLYWTVKALHCILEKLEYGGQCSPVCEHLVSFGPLCWVNYHSVILAATSEGIINIFAQP